MGIQDPGRLSLGQWHALVDGWNERHGDGAPKPPTEEEFEAARQRAREMLH